MIHLKPILAAMLLTYFSAGSYSLAAEQTGGDTMPQKQVRAYGEWASPLSSELIVAESIALSEPLFDGDDIYWLEGRPQEEGRRVLVRRTADGNVADITKAPFDVASRVHEYGGGAYWVVDGVVYFSNFSDSRLYRLRAGQEPKAITTDSNMRYADFRMLGTGTRLVAVREDHSHGGEPVNSLVVLDTLKPSAGKVIASGYDFYSSPRPSPNGKQLTWLAWNHPNMPWDGTELWLADISTDGSLSNTRKVAGGIDESIFQPQWSPAGILHFVSDRSGWWNLYRLTADGAHTLHSRNAEFGQPQWRFGMSTYGFEAEDSIICVYTVNGTDRLARLNTVTGELVDTGAPYSSISGVQVQNNGQLFVGGAASRFSELVWRKKSGNTQALRQSAFLDLDGSFVSTAEPIEFPTTDGLTAHAFYYSPKSRDFKGPTDLKPPLIVMSHGGPTGATTATLSLGVQYWTSRGFAVVDVNYGGSTGFGREYRRRLNGQWGVVDVHDSVNAAKYLVEQGLVDGNRLAIRGGSAGGYTTLAALTFTKVFSAGASYYGISDIEALVQDTHKFESRYIDSLIGPYPQVREIYRARSPIHHIKNLSSPVIFFQGLEDKVVPPNQAERMFHALQQKGLPTAYLGFDGEGHGFRRAENQRRALDAELYFYGKVFELRPAGKIKPVAISNASQ